MSISVFNKKKSDLYGRNFSFLFEVYATMSEACCISLLCMQSNSVEWTYNCIVVVVVVVVSIAFVRYYDLVYCAWKCNQIIWIKINRTLKSMFQRRVLNGWNPYLTLHDLFDLESIFTTKLIWYNSIEDVRQPLFARDFGAIFCQKILKVYTFSNLCQTKYHFNSTGFM